MRKKVNLSILTVNAFLLLALTSCSTFIGRNYDDTTARYNSYYLAKEKMKEVDVALKNYSKDDYHKILNIHYPSDSNFGKSQNQALEEVFKYASWSVRWHKRSKWADNNYILIGKVRHYQYNYKDGIETFKYVNSTSKSPKDRHEAMICLMRFFTDFGEYDNVGYVIDYMDKETGMTRKNKRDYLVAKAAYYQHFEDYAKVHKLLDTAISLSRRKHDKARLSFINGQVAEYLKQESSGETKVVMDDKADKDAYDNYTRTIRSNPKYELWFNARLNRMRVSPTSDLKDVDKARKYFKKMLADQKNKEYKDRIYYEYGAFERKLKEYPEAEEHFKNSVTNATANQKQKAYSYLALGEMYYDDQQRFEDAKLYYDSAIAILPRDHKGYSKIYRRQRILKDFVEHLNVVKREDSLQKLASMDTASLNKFLDDYIVKEEKRLNDEAKRLAKLARKNAGGDGQSPFNTDFVPSGNPAATGVNSPAGFSTGQQMAQFYFYNSAVATQGKIEFQQKWGRRKLEDNWRISSKDQQEEENVQAAPADTSKARSGTGSEGNNQVKKEEEEDEETIRISKEELVATIPLTEDKMKASHQKLQTSLFKLGKIYNQHLNEPDNSVKSLQRLIEKYPENENVPEAHYIIYLIMKGKDSSAMVTHKDILLDKYPHTIYAKIIANPNYLAESKMLNKQIMARYKTAYESYLSKNYHEADSLFTLIQTDYPDSEFEPKIDLIKAIIKAREGKKDEYKNELLAYVDQYKSGVYHDYAQSLITKLEGGKPKADKVPKDTVSSPAPAMPEKFIPQADPGGTLPDDMPEEVRKIYEEQMRKRPQGNTNRSLETLPGGDADSLNRSSPVPSVPGNKEQVKDNLLPGESEKAVTPGNDKAPLQNIPQTSPDTATKTATGKQNTPPAINQSTADPSNNPLQNRPNRAQPSLNNNTNPDRTTKNPVPTAPASGNIPAGGNTSSNPGSQPDPSQGINDRVPPAQVNPPVSPDKNTATPPNPVNRGQNAPSARPGQEINQVPASAIPVNPEPQNDNLNMPPNNTGVIPRGQINGNPGEPVPPAIGIDPASQPAPAPTPLQPEQGEEINQVPQGGNLPNGGQGERLLNESNQSSQPAPAVPGQLPVPKDSLTNPGK